MKNLIFSVTLLSLTFGSAALWAQQQDPAPPAKTSATEWVEQLGHDDYAKREAAAKALEGLGEAARSSLEQAKDSKNLEQRQRARTLLAALDAPSGGAGNGDVAERLRSLREQGRRRPQRGLTPDPRPRSQRLQRVRPAPRAGQVVDLDDLMEEMREKMESLGVNDLQVDRSGIGPGRRLDIPFMNMRGNSSTTTVTSQDNVTLKLTQSKKNGVKLTVTTRDPATGSTSVQNHEAPSMEIFKERFPEVVEAHRSSGVFDMGMESFSLELPRGLGGSFGLSGPGIGQSAEDFARFMEQMRKLKPMPRGSPRLPPHLRRGQPIELLPDMHTPNGSIVSSGPKLGIVLSPVPSVLRAHVDLPEQALIIDEVQPGSLAQRMGLKPHDVLSQVNGVSVGSTFDVRKVLGKASGTVEVLIHRKGSTQSFTGQLPK